MVYRWREEEKGLIVLRMNYWYNINGKKGSCFVKNVRRKYESKKRWSVKWSNWIQKIRTSPPMNPSRLKFDEGIDR